MSLSPNKINIEKELQHLVDFIAISWILPSNLTIQDLKILLEKPFKDAVASAKYRFEFKAQEALFELHDKHSKYIDDKFSPVNSAYDATLYTLNTMEKGLKLLSSNPNFSHPEFCKPYIQIAKTHLNNINATLYPKSYGKHENLTYPELKENYERGLFEDYYEEDENEVSQLDKDREFFKGHPFKIGSRIFVEYTTLPHIMESDVNQGRCPITELIGITVTHGLIVAQHNNTIEMINDINNINLSTEFEEELTELTNNEILTEAFKLAEPKFTFNKMPEELKKIYILSC